MLWAAQAAHLGVKWVVGNGTKLRFWEDNWVGNTNLAIMFWPLYVINEQHGKTVRSGMVKSLCSCLEEMYLNHL